MLGGNRTIIVLLGVVGLGAASLGGYFALRSRARETKELEAPRVVPMAAPKDALHQKREFKRRPPPGTPAALDGGEGYVVSDEEIKDLLAEMPTEEQAKGLRRPPAPKVEGVANKGLDALVELESCAPGFELEESGRKSSGALGCVRFDAGRRIYDGPVGFKVVNPVPPGVPTPAPLYEVGRFEGGKRNGEFRNFDSSGQLVAVRVFKDDLLTGAVDEFSVTGEHLARTNYLDGFLHGPVIHFLGENVRLGLWGYGVPLDPMTGARNDEAKRLEAAKAMQ